MSLTSGYLIVFIYHIIAQYGVVFMSDDISNLVGFFNLLLQEGDGSLVRQSLLFQHLFILLHFL